MPAVSDKQKRFMDAAAHNPKFAKQAGVPIGVAQDFSEASKGQKFNTGTRPDRQEINKPKTDHGSMNLFKKGGMMKSDLAQDKAMIKKAFKEHDAQEHKGGTGTKIVLCKGGNVKKMAKGGFTGAPGVKKDLPTSKQMGTLNMAKGGAAKEVMGPSSMKKDVEKGSNKLEPFGQSAVQKRGMTKGKNFGDSGSTAKETKFPKFAKGGSVSNRGDGIAQKGKTKTKYC